MVRDRESERYQASSCNTEPRYSLGVWKAGSGNTKMENLLQKGKRKTAGLGKQ